MLDDVVVVAYGTAKSHLLQDQRLLLVEKKYSKVKVSSVSKALEGAAAGVQVIQ